MAISSPQENPQAPLKHIETNLTPSAQLVHETCSRSIYPALQEQGLIDLCNQAARGEISPDDPDLLASLALAREAAMKTGNNPVVNNFFDRLNS